MAWEGDRGSTMVASAWQGADTEQGTGRSEKNAGFRWGFVWAWGVEGLRVEFRTPANLPRLCIRFAGIWPHGLIHKCMWRPAGWQKWFGPVSSDVCSRFVARRWRCPNACLYSGTNVGGISHLNCIVVHLAYYSLPCCALTTSPFPNFTPLFTLTKIYTSTYGFRYNGPHSRGTAPLGH